MSDDEKEVLRLLGLAWNKFLELPAYHYMDNHEFCHAIHAAQNIVLARAGMREEGIVRLEPDNRVNLEVGELNQ